MVCLRTLNPAIQMTVQEEGYIARSGTEGRGPRERRVEQRGGQPLPAGNRNRWFRREARK